MTTLGNTGQNKYLYDRRNTQEMKFNYNNKTLTVTNIVAQASNLRAADTNIGEYTVWITNIQGSTDNDAQKISFLLYHISGAYNAYNGKWGSRFQQQKILFIRE
ncbi:hypothetical protein SAMN02745150_00562 [Brevinema andersonii]|uniref:Uncharacterized protein n=1 Tax=Brevinema andersonii TaxID=34097 RepID=A0A1I1DJQ8_BREAD|nr:hypothetical protein [Brevinema andersonii]SFB74602.1 hypothetical protein SAMN02745150_00562 [Brevinema andersonii]